MSPINIEHKDAFIDMLYNSRRVLVVALLRLKRRIPIVAPDFVSANMLSVAHQKSSTFLHLGRFCHLPSAAEILWRSCPRGSCGGVLPHWFQGPHGLRSGR